MKEKKNNTTNKRIPILVWTVLGILILGGIAVATTTIRDDKIFSPLVTVDNISLQSTSINYNSSLFNYTNYAVGYNVGSRNYSFNGSINIFVDNGAGIKRNVLQITSGNESVFFSFKSGLGSGSTNQPTIQPYDGDIQQVGKTRNFYFTWYHNDTWDIANLYPSSRTYFLNTNSSGRLLETLDLSTVGAYFREPVRVYNSYSDASGDAQISFPIEGAGVWSIGTDNSDNDAFVISRDFSLGPFTKIRMDQNNLKIRNFTDINISVTNDVRILQGNLTITESRGSGNVLACLDANGKLYRGNTTGCPSPS